jgi:hypothetical protein
MFTGVQHLDIFHEVVAVIEAATTTTTTDQRMIVIVGQWQLGHCRHSWGGDVLP